MLNLIKKVKHFAKLFGEFSVFQVAVKGLGAVSGILAIRFMSVEDYSGYTILLAAFSFICVFSDLGATETLAYFRWRFRLSEARWKNYTDAVKRFRFSAFLLSVLLSIPYIGFASTKVGSLTTDVLFDAVLAAVAAYFYVKSSISVFVLRLEQRFRQSYFTEIFIELVKATGMVAIVVLGMLSVTGALVILVIAAWIGSAYAAHCVHRPAGVGSRKHRLRSTKRRVKILAKQVCPALPGAAHFAVQGVLVTALAAIYGGAGSVAEVGALGRLSVLIAFIAGFSSSVFFPRLLANTELDALRRRYLEWMGLLALIGAILVCAATFWGDAFLRVLGEAYSHLNSELVLAVMNAVAAILAGSAWNVNRALGWVRLQPYSVLVIGSVQVIMFVCMDLGTTKEIILFSLVTTFTGCVYQLLVNAIGFRRQVIP